jgi:hypothetical protein
MNAAPPGGTVIRTIVVGSRSRLWSALATQPGLTKLVSAAISHTAVGQFAFQPTDRVWVLSYSRRPAQNRQLLEQLRQAGVAEICYVSSSSVIVCTLTRCYQYPRIKADAEAAALRIPGGRIVTLGLVYAQAAELPGGDNIATSCRELAEFMCDPDWPADAGRRKLLFHRLHRPFRRGFEAAVYAAYDRLLSACGRCPCLLRPLDLLLRLCGCRWYGYVRLSNRLWYSTISS